MNRKEFKQAMSGVQSSEQTIERIMDMTSEKSKKRVRIAPLATAVVCLAVLVAGIFGENAITARIGNTEIEPKVSTTQNNSISSSKVAPGFVMVAYANDDMKDIEVVEDFNKLDTAMPFLSKIGVVDIQGKSRKEIDKIIDDIKTEYKLIEKTADGKTVNYVMTTGTEVFDNAVIYHANCGSFDFDLESGTIDNVKEIRVKNKNTDFGYMEIRALDCRYDEDLNLKNDGIDYTKSAYRTDDLSGDRYRRCKAIDEKEGNHKNFGINWKMSSDAYYKLNENPNYDLSTITDTITFEVEFNDGSISKSVIDVAFDKNGEMYAVGSQYDFIK